jgi:Zn-dependent protease
MRTSLKIGSLMGIPIRLHVTFLILMPLIVLVFAQAPKPLGLGDIEGLSQPIRYSVAAVAALLFFSSLLIHELSHSYVAMKYGTSIKSITLFIFGGLAMMEELPREPEKEWRIAIAGPLVSFTLGGTFLLAYFGLAALMPRLPDSFVVLLFSIGLLNLILGTFNLLPAFPMDGGRILRAWLAKRMQFLSATKRAVLVGKILAVMMGVVGLLPDPFLLLATGELRMPFNPWLTLIAFFLFLAATEEESMTITLAALEGLTVRQVMRTGDVSVRADMLLSALAEKMLRERTAEYAVVDDTGAFKGLVNFAELNQRPAEDRYRLTVADVLPPSDWENETISEAESAVQALKRMTQTKRKMLAVVDGEFGSIVGLVTRRDLGLVIEMLRGRG